MTVAVGFIPRFTFTKRRRVAERRLNQSVDFQASLRDAPALNRSNRGFKATATFIPSLRDSRSPQKSRAQKICRRFEIIQRLVPVQPRSRGGLPF